MLANTGKYTQIRFYDNGSSINYRKVDETGTIITNGELATLNDITRIKIDTYKEMIELFPEKKEKLEKMIKLQELELNKKE
ncbi:hypothetical protein [Mycobacterium sp.]|uniref:hypothetical protein n=1 Tax=Mycobacterium sp. TaxID=1785 RepID=UPI003A85E40C